MAKRYAIWNKKDDIFTPGNEHLTAEEWLERYPWARNPQAVPVITAGVINGGRMDELGMLKTIWEGRGVAFPEGLSNEELLDAIEEAEDYFNDPANFPPTVEERTAAALEFLAMSSLPDEA